MIYHNILNVIEGCPFDMEGIQEYLQRKRIIPWDTANYKNFVVLDAGKRKLIKEYSALF